MSKKNKKKEPERGEVFGEGKDLTKMSPRSPRERVAGFVVLARMIDKCRAELWGDSGEYKFGCGLDQKLLAFKGVYVDALRSLVAQGKTDKEIGEWFLKKGVSKSEEQIKEWSDRCEGNNYSSDPEKKKWLESENERLGLSKDATLFDMLDADDRLM